MVPVEYGTLTQTFHLKMWFFHSITGISFKWNYVLWRTIALLVWIGICTKLSIYKVPQTQSDGLVEVLDLYGEHSC